jgi:nitroreductase
MDVIKAIDDRISIRGFTEKSVSREVIEQLLNAARKAPSASNQQPWNFVVVTGETRKRLCNDLLEACKKRNKHYDPSWGKTIPPIYLERTKKLLKAIRPHLKEMNQQAVPFLEEGSCLLYGAPVLILVTMDKAHPKSKLVDIGCAVENLVLAAHEKGLGTCIIALILTFEQLIRERLEIADSQALVVGVALGHPDGTLPVNNLRAPKEELTEMTRWVGFS